MEKVPTLLWILLAVGAFVYRMVQKMRATAAQEQRARPRAPALPTASFQELLKQMQAHNAAETGGPPPPAADRVPPVPGTPGGRPVPRPRAPVARSQERTPRRPASSDALAAARPISRPAPLVQRGASLPRAVITAQTDATYRPFAPGAPAPEPTGAVVRRLLAQPANVRAAFVLVEILGRRPW